MKKQNLNQIKKGREILEALKKYGIMNRRTLQKIVPSIKDPREFRRTLNRLCARQLIVKRYDTLNGITGAFYQINQLVKIRDILSVYLNCRSVDLAQREFRYRQLFHEQTASLIAHHLTWTYPQALVLRDYELARNDEAKKVIPHLDDFKEPRPDVLLIFPQSVDFKSLAIAIEFERTSKAKHRLAEKLKFYTTKTLIDGVFYICSKDRIQNNLIEIYESKILERALRINHYGHNYLLTSILQDDVENSLASIRNQTGNHYSFDYWIHMLLQNPSAKRRDECFKQLPPGGGGFEI